MERGEFKKIVFQASKDDKSSPNNCIHLLTLHWHIDKIFDEHEAQLKAQEAKSCETCSKSKKCQILHKFYLHRLKTEGYAMHKNEFYCNQYDYIF